MTLLNGRGCHDCGYFRRSAEAPGDAGSCHRHPPVAQPPDQIDNETIFVRFGSWPRVRDTDFCGEWYPQPAVTVDAS
jgi:hypothetical protein